MSEISHLYGENYNFSSYNGPDTSTKYIVATAPRSGSSFLATLLYHNIGFGLPLEYFNIDSMEARYNSTKTKSFKEYYNHIVRHRSDSCTGVFGAKMFARYAIMMRDIFPDLFERLFEGSALILLNRKDVVAQSVSLVRARQTCRWFGNHHEMQTPEYDPDAIGKALRYIRLNEKWWSEFAQEKALPFLTLWYEDILEDQSAALQSLRHFLGLAALEERAGDRFSLMPQRDDLNAEWAERFKRDMGSI